MIFAKNIKLRTCAVQANAQTAKSSKISETESHPRKYCKENTIPLTKKMSMSMGAYASFKVRDSMGSSGNFCGGKQQSQSSSGNSSGGFFSNSADKYNDKKMMGVWGDYNRYSVHNMKSQNSFEKA